MLRRLSAAQLASRCAVAAAGCLALAGLHSLAAQLCTSRMDKGVEVGNPATVFAAALSINHQAVGYA